MINLRKLPIFLLQFLLGFLIALPLSVLVNKRKNLVSFIGRDNGIFTDNVKYFFLYLHYLKPCEIEYYFITENKKTYREIKDLNLPALYYPSFRSVYVLLRSHILIVDNWTWITNIKYHLLYKAKKIQIWHGVPLKKIELDTNIELRKSNLIFIKLRNLFGSRYPKYNCIVSTSELISTRAFSSAFKTKSIINSGYPRNDILFNTARDEQLLGTDIENYYKILKYRESGHKIILYTPTFRDSGGNILIDSGIDLEILSQFAVNNKIIFILKFHPNPDKYNDLKNIQNIIEYDNTADIYPVFRISDLLITDYSSTFFDYLLLNKPIIFFSFDLEKYLQEDREMYFDYDKYTPGTKVSNQSELQKEILKIFIDKIDCHKDHRKQILNKAFLYKDGNSSKRLWNHIDKEYIKN
jgi:CDP-glycerol glycerophosphotransferase